MTNLLLAGILAILILILVQLMVNARMSEARHGRKARGIYYLIDGVTGVIMAVFFGVILFLVFYFGAATLSGIFVKPL
jgi:succinate dehydrogenase hydrophobic anchor subunit